LKLGTRVALALGPVALLAAAAGAVGLAVDRGAAGWTAFGLGVAAAIVAIAAGRVLLTALREPLSQIAGRVKVLASGDLAQFAHSSELYAAGSEQQAAAVEEISATMERLSAAAQQIAGGASRATAAAADGRAAVDQTASGVAQIHSAVEVAVERGTSLRRGSQRVGEVADAISAIAERTHILALNAAIEAASAGDYGRRFGVVAGQVRELAGDTRRATEQVKATVAELREAIESLEASAEGARAVAARVDDQAQRAAVAIGDVVAVVEQIARATVSQHSASAELVRTMREIVAVAQESAQSSREAAAGAARMNATAAELQALVARLQPASEA
jgi:methyl-accepting chemotaxis protein